METQSWSDCNLCSFEGAESIGCRGKDETQEESLRTHTDARPYMAERMARKAAANESKLCLVSGDNSLRDPPVPIPNTEVKPQHADSTWLETAR